MLSDMVNEDILFVKNVKALIVGTVLFLANVHIHAQQVLLKPIQLLHFLGKSGLEILS